MAIALYARKSIERENSISCETQLEYCKSVIKPDERREKIVSFIDNGFSGGNIDRDGFRDMMRQVEKGKISKIIVYRLDRISRSLSDFVSILETLKKHHVQFVSSQESFDTSSPYGEMIVKILMIFAEFERQSIIERVTQAYAHRSEIGLYMGGRRPYGFRLKDTVIHNIKTKMYEPVPEEVEQIKYIFESYAVPNVTLRRLMDNLIQNNILPSNGSWSTGKLSAILKNPLYVKADNSIYEYYSSGNANIISDISAFDGIHGLQIYGKTKHTAEDMSDIKVVVMAHEGIVGSDVWMKCRKKIERNKQIGNSISNSTSWLGGKIACKQCGRTMTVTRGGKHKDGTQTRYFSCTGKSHNRVCKGTNVTLYADSLEDMAYRLISEKLETLKGSRKKVSTDNSNKINLLKNRISEIKLSQDKLVNMLLNDEFDKAMIALLNEKAKKLSEERQELTERIETLENEESEIISVINLSKKWETANTEERKAVCNVLIHKIYIDEDGTAEVVWNI
uniref:Resolvase n=1 Tax=uncultured Bacillota bacterium TaxID=344338 RepID=A0A650EMS1_9FIRM|nr:resolvase [uncultured Firmicutes bacterium]